ncbi:MAG TPA: hypothetical protein VF424_14215, partial [Vicinamibacterales bacterium]
PPPPPPPPPPPVVNNAPVIRSIGVALSRVEVEQDVEVTAEVDDAETNPDQLTYEWTATAGTITGSGRTVRWRLAKGATQTPVDVTVSLAVVERYTETVNSLIITREHRVTQSAAPFRAHDSDAELRKISIEFLVYLFGNSNVSPSACLVDFSDSCRGKQDELQDNENNRRTFQILSAQATVASVAISADRLSADVIAPCVFRDREIATGHEATSSGDCYLTAVYERSRWWLCSSSFLNGSRQISMFDFFRLNRRRGGAP